MRHRRVGRFLFRGLSGVGFRRVKVFQKNTTRRDGDFFENRLRPDLYLPLKTQTPLPEEQK
jgi:hypothetical protein